jgi:hypothetical protein
MNILKFERKYDSEQLEYFAAEARLLPKAECRIYDFTARLVLKRLCEFRRNPTPS